MIGAGIFTTSGLLMQDLHNPVVMLALWLIGGLVALCGALSYGELGAAIPHAGGEYAFLSRLYHPVLGFLSGWVSFFVGFSAPIAASAIGFSEYLTRAFPGLLHPGLFPGASEATIMKKLYAILIIAAFTFLHTRGLEAGARVQNALTGLKILLIVGLVAAGFAVGKGSLAHLTAAAPFRFDFAGIKTMGLSLMWIMFAYSGWNASAYVGSEVRDPSRNLPRSLLLGTAVVMVLYAALNLFYVYAIAAGPDGRRHLGRRARRGQPLRQVRRNGPLPPDLVRPVLLAQRLSHPRAARLLFDGPGRHLLQVHRLRRPEARVPTRSIVLQGGIAVAMVFLGTFEQLLTYMGFSLGIFPLLAVLGVFKLRRSGRSAVKLPGYPVASAVYILVGAAILVLAFLRAPVESLVAIATALVGIPVYLFFKSRTARKRG